jgi:hypothetical protein
MSISAQSAPPYAARLSSNFLHYLSRDRASEFPDSSRLARKALTKPKVVNGARIVGRQFNLQAVRAARLFH